MTSAVETPANATSTSTPTATYKVWKVVQPPGAYAYPVMQDGKTVNRLALFTPEKNRRYAKTVNSMVNDGVLIPIIPEHDTKGVPLTRSEWEKKVLAECVGFVRGARTTKDGALELLHEVTDPTWVPKMGTTVLDCSPGFRDWYRTGDGKKWTDVVAHVALTNNPVDHHKPKFVPAGKAGTNTPGGEGGYATFMSLTPTGPESPQLVPIWEVPFSAALACIQPAGTSHIFKHADGKQRFGSRSLAVNWLRSQYSKQFSINAGGNAIWMAVMRSPIGGVHIQGKFYPGGQFIPNEVIERATPEEKKKIHDAREGYAKNRATEAQSHMQDAESVHDAILRHAGAYGKAEQHPLDKRDTLRRWAALKNEHGEKGALERVVTLAAKEAKALQAMGPDGLNASSGKYYARRLTAYAQMVGFAVNPGSVDDYKRGLKEALAGEGGKRSMREAGSDPSKDVADVTPAEKVPAKESAKEAVKKPQQEVVRSNPFEAGLKQSDLTSKMREEYGKTAKMVYDRLSPAAKERFDKHVESVSFHESPDVLTEKLKEANPKMTEVVGSKKAGGAYSKMQKELMLNGGHRMDGKKYTADQIYAHEYSHAIDGPDKELSSSSEWREAWKAEAKNLSKYATKTPAEGFAEFGRMVYAGELGSEQLRERYPGMMGYFESAGLLPEGIKQQGGTLAEPGSPQMSDVFEAPFDTPEHIGDKALAQRGASESLKDYLTGIGGAGAHDTIRDYAKQLHAEEQGMVDQHNSAYSQAIEALASHHGRKLTQADIKKFGDHTKVKGFDEVLTEVTNSHPGLFQTQYDKGNWEGAGAEDHGETWDNAEKLWEILKIGKKDKADLREFEDKAVQEWHDNGRPMPEGYEPEAVDTSFDFGANVGGNNTEGGTPKPSKTAESDDNPFKSTPEEDRAAWEKFAAKARREGGNTLITPGEGGILPQPSAETRGDGGGTGGRGMADRDTDDLLKRKMEAEKRRHEETKAREAAIAEAIRNPKFDPETGKPLTGGKKPASFDEQYDHTKVPVITNDQIESENWDTFHPGLGSELVMRKSAAGMKGINGEEYAIREHSPGKFQMISRKAKAEKDGGTQEWKHGHIESGNEALARVKASPNQPDRDWEKYAERFGIEGKFHHVEIPTDELAKNLESGHLRRSNSVNADTVKNKVESGDRNPVLITKEPGKGSLVVDGNHSLQAAIQNGDKTVKAIVSEKSPFATPEPQPTPLDIATGNMPKRTTTFATLASPVDPNLGYHEEGGKFYAKDRYGEPVRGESFDSADEAEERTEELAAGGHQKKEKQSDGVHVIPAMGNRSEMKVKFYPGRKEGEIGIGWDDKYDKPWTYMPEDSKKHFLNDLSGKVDLPANSSNEIVNEIAKGKGEWLGKGQDGVVFRVGDKVAKMSTTVPFQPMNPGHRSPQEAIAHLEKGVKVNNKLAEMGIPGIMKQEFVTHGDKAFAIRDNLEMPEKLTPEQLQGVRRSIDAIHKAGYVVGDEIQVGIKDGKPYLFDLGNAQKARDDQDYEDDSNKFERLAKRMTGDEYELPLRRHAENALAKHLEHKAKRDAKGEKQWPNLENYANNLRKGIAASDESEGISKNEQDRTPLEIATGVTSTTPGTADNDTFMKPTPAGRYSADDIEELAGQSFTNDKGLTVDLVKDEDGTWSVGSKYGLSAQAAADHLNAHKAEVARGLFGAEVTKQDTAKKEEKRLMPGDKVKYTGRGADPDDEVEFRGYHDVNGQKMARVIFRPKNGMPYENSVPANTVAGMKEKLQWAEPAKRKDVGGELPGMRDTFAPGMFGQAANAKTLDDALEPIDDEPASESDNFNPQVAIGIAADSIEKLRGSDVYRVLNSSTDEHYDKIKDHILQKRPDLKADVEEAHADIKGEQATESQSSQPQLEGWHKENFDSASQAMNRHMATKSNPRHKLEAAMRLVHGEPPAVQNALLDHLKKTEPDTYEYGKQNPNSIGLSVRQVFADHAEASSKGEPDKPDVTPAQIATGEIPSPVTSTPSAPDKPAEYAKPGDTITIPPGTRYGMAQKEIPAGTSGKVTAVDTNENGKPIYRVSFTDEKGRERSAWVDEVDEPGESGTQSKPQQAGDWNPAWGNPDEVLSDGKTTRAKHYANLMQKAKAYDDKKAGFTITDMTPAGYGPSSEPAGSEPTGSEPNKPQPSPMEIATGVTSTATNPSTPLTGVSGASTNAHYLTYSGSLQDKLAEIIRSNHRGEPIPEGIITPSRIKARYDLGITPEAAAAEIYNDLVKPRLEYKAKHGFEYQDDRNPIKEAKEASQKAIEKLRAQQTEQAAKDIEKSQSGKPVEIAPSVSIPAETHQEVNTGELFKAAEAAEAKGGSPSSPSTPREVAAAVKRATDPAYAFARASSVSNAGEDLQYSKRHLANAWRGLEEAEQDGTAEKLVTRDKLLENEPHNLMTHAEKNPLTSMAMHFAMKHFPLTPSYKSSKYSRATTDPEKLKKNRQQYVEAFRSIKGKAEKLAESETDPKKALSALADHVGSVIRALRGQQGHDSISRATATDIYNEIANALTKMPKQLRDGTSWRTESSMSPMGRINEFTKHLADKHGMPPATGGTPEEKQAYREKLNSAAKNVIEGQSPAKAFGVSSDKGKTGSGSKPKITPAEMYVDRAERKGGREVPRLQSALKDHLLKKTGLRGLQFGNYVTDDERSHHLEKAAEAFVDLADVLGLPDNAISLGGNLGLAFGARGSGGALAHYEPSTKVINLTRKGGVGSLAHEWGHGLDHFLAGGGKAEAKGGSINTGMLSTETSPERFERDASGNWKKDEKGRMVTINKKDDPVWAAMDDVRKSWDNSGFKKRLGSYIRDLVDDGYMSESKANYWRSNSEMFARTFEQWVQHELLEQGRQNTYLAGFDHKEYGDDKVGSKLWPTREESRSMGPAFKKLMSAIREKHFSQKDMSIVGTLTRDERIANMMIALQV